MLDFSDLHHLPVLDELVHEMVHDAPGLVLAAGFDPPDTPGLPPESGGRSVLFGILVRHFMAAHPNLHPIFVVSGKDSVRLAPRQRRRAALEIRKPGETLGETAARAARRMPRLLVLEELDADSLAPALDTVRNGGHVLAQFDTPLRGKWVARQLVDMGASVSQLDALRWVIAACRLPALCVCKERDADADNSGLGTRDGLAAATQLGNHSGTSVPTFYRPGGCERCHGTGRQGEIAAFDVWQNNLAIDPLQVPSRLPLQDYALGLAAQGYVGLEDVRDLYSAQLYRMDRLYRGTVSRATNASTALERKLLELEASTRNLEHQTRASISLQEIAHWLISANDAAELANYVCRKARDLCGADRAVLYLMRPDHTARIVAVGGWDAGWLNQTLDADQLYSPAATAGEEASSFKGFPPGIPSRSADVEGVYLRAGLRVPLVAQHEVVGLVIFQSTVKRDFSPRERALLQALANSSAMALQRASLIEALQDKVARLEAAQRDLAQKERLDRELELARQVQQSMLPQQFPLLPGLHFFARSIPARQVGGDLYDVLVLDGDRVGVVIGDVSDKGMPAALFMALTSSILYAEAKRELSPRLVLERVHHLLMELAPSTMFVTLFYGVVQLSARQLTYARAGHEPPILVRDGQTSLLGGEGTVIGLVDLPDVRLTEETLALLPGDRLVLYTDGVVDAEDHRQAPFGRKRLVRECEQGARLPLEQFGAALFDALAGHQGAAEQFDDVTVLAVQLG